MKWARSAQEETRLSEQSGTLADDPLETDRVETRYHDHGAPAWLATIKRI